MKVYFFIIWIVYGLCTGLGAFISAFGTSNIRGISHFYGDLRHCVLFHYSLFIIFAAEKTGYRTGALPPDEHNPLDFVFTFSLRINHNK